MTKKKYRGKIEYEGTRYLGWQRLGGKDREKTIQGKVELLFARLFECAVEEVELVASGRTDAGVHAKAQVFHVELPNTWQKPIQDLESLCNHYLPEDIRIYDLEECEASFHSRYHATAKEYHYRLALQKGNVFERNLIWTVETSLDLNKIRQALPLLLGTHDFLGFSSLKKTKKSTLRTLLEVEVLEKPTELLFRFRGDGFLQNMVRILVGTLIEIGEGKKDQEDILKIFETKQRALAGFLAPAKGLILYEVSYS